MERQHWGFITDSDRDPGVRIWLGTMKSAWVGFIASALTLLIGFSLVLIFTLFYVVPTISAHAMIKTQCQVEQISSYVIEDSLWNTLTEQYLLAPNFTLSNDTRGPESGIALSPINCTVIVVSYSLSNGQHSNGFLYQQKDEGSDCIGQKKVSTGVFVDKAPWCENPSGRGKHSIVCLDVFNRSSGNECWVFLLFQM